MVLLVQKVINRHALQTAIAIIWGKAICAPLAKERLQIRLVCTVLFERAGIGSPQNPHGFEFELPTTSPSLSARLPNSRSSRFCADSTDSNQESSGGCSA